MDGFELIRKAAEELHDQVVAGGADSLSPLVLVQAAAKQLGLELAWLDEGDPALKNARALFDVQSGLIICQVGGSDGERALLVAHEIGHVVTHVGSTTCATGDIDPSRSTESAPVGLQRVEDYGAHERRELQANVFAREFVLPRKVTRRLHVAEAKSSLDIAAATGLAIALVRQQLLDALLLPPAPEETVTVEAKPLKPDPSQDRAVAHRASPFQLQAGPGTGKTRTLVKRVQALLGEDVDPASILVLTYSNRAAGELAERLSLAASDTAPKIWIGTFHAFGLDLIRRHHDLFGLSANPPLFDRSDAIEVLEEILPTLPLVHYRNIWDPASILREVVQAISRAKDEMTDPKRYRELGEAMKTAAGTPDEIEAAEKALEVAHIYELYEGALRAHGGVDFGDLIMRPALQLEKDEALRTTVALRHRHILVDEYQDVNHASAWLLKALGGDGKRLWVVGDARQSIYRFRGASAANMAAFGASYPGAGIDKLEISYRSSKEIIDTFQAVAPRMGASENMLPLALTAAEGASGVAPELARFETLDDEAGGIAARVRALEAEGLKLRDQANLCRTNDRLNEIADALEQRGIPVLHLGSLFERNEVRDLLALISFAIDPFGDALVRIAAMPRYGIPLQDVYLALSHVRASPQSPVKALGSLSDVEGLSLKGVAALKLLAADMEKIEKRSAWELLAAYMLDRTDLALELAGATTVSEQVRAVGVWQFLNFVRDQGPLGSRIPLRRTLDRARQLVLLAEERDLRQVPQPALHLDAVRLMTVHASKGLEFEAVHVPGLTVSSFPSSYRGSRCPPPQRMIQGAAGEDPKRAHADEEECLFFVALSRARKRLSLTHARLQRNGNNRTPSPFLDLVRGVVREISDPPVIPLPPDAPRPRAVVLTFPDDWHTTDAGLIAFDKCPRRFFYTHILGLGGGKKPTAFTQTHDCLYDFIRWLAEARSSEPPSLEQAEAAFERIWKERGPPADHAFIGDYNRLARRMVRVLIEAGAGRRFMDAEPIFIDFAKGRVLVKPDEIAEREDGVIVIRRVHTGHQRDKEYDRLEYALYHLAAQAKFGAGAVVEAIHLTDEVSAPAETTPKKMATRRQKAEAMVAAIADGAFPIDTDNFRCPRCPHFFICDALPEGPLQLVSGFGPDERSTQ
jgi:DNA helicase II / ATP-dependent DNA helicase PcrA